MKDTRNVARAAKQAERRAAKSKRIAASTREGSTTVTADDIIVIGVRESVSKSIDRKRTARQIVDVITAEDAGKLPDNNVVEAMSRVPGIAITRKEGRPDGFTIRGLAGVHTTVNGMESATAPLPGDEGRTLALSSIPANSSNRWRCTRPVRPIRSRAGSADR